jgi:hypothetical protein
MLKNQPSQNFKKMESLQRACCHLSNGENDASNEHRMEKLWLVKIQVNPEETCGRL